MNLKTIIFFIVIPFVTQSVYSQADPHDISHHFFETWSSAGLNTACQGLLTTNPWRPVNDSIQIRLEKRLLLASQRKGKYLDYEVLETDTISPSFIQISFLIKFDREPLFLRLTFYKPAEKWQYQTFELDQENISSGRVQHPAGKRPSQNSNSPSAKQKGRL